MLASERAVYVLSLVVLILFLPAVCGISNGSGGSGILSGTSAVLGPGTLGAGGCDTATITVTGVTSAMAIVATPAAGDIAGGLGTIHWFGYRSAANNGMYVMNYEAIKFSAGDTQNGQAIFPGVQVKSGQLIEIVCTVDAAFVPQANSRIIAGIIGYYYPNGVARTN